MILFGLKELALRKKSANACKLTPNLWMSGMESAYWGGSFRSSKETLELLGAFSF